MRRVTSYYEYTTQDGDTFDLLALDMYNDERLAHYIIEYNPDYADVIVHVFCKDAREFYQLERLWADAEPVDISQWVKPD